MRKKNDKYNVDLKAFLLFFGFALIVGLIYFLSFNKSNREKFEAKISNHSYNQRCFANLEDIKLIPKKDRPDLAWEHDFLITQDPKLGYPPKERLVSIYNHVKEFKRLKAGIPGDINNDWVERGPDNVGGRIRALMFDPNDINDTKAWAGSVSGGLWYNNDITDVSSNWVVVDDFWANLAISTIAYDPSNTQVYYVGTGEGWYNADAVRGAGIWKSSNAGVNWTRLASTDNSDFSMTQKIIITASGRIVAATNSGIFVSDDGGVVWTKTENGFTGDLEIASNGDIYAGKGRLNTSGALLKSTDSGDNWTDITPVGTTQERVEIALAPSNSDVLYAIASGEDAISWFKKSTDGGTNWVNVAIPKYKEQSCTLSTDDDFTRGQHWYDLILAVHPLDENIVIAGGIDLNKSTDGGTNWSTVSYWTGTCHPYVHADQHMIVFRPNNPNEAIFGNDGGVSYSADVGNATEPTFNDRNNGLNITQYYSGAMHPDARRNYYIGGTQDNGSHKFTDAGVNSVVEVTGGDGAYSFIDQKNPDIQITSYVYNNYYYSKDAGGSFTNLQSSNDGSFINPTGYDSKQHVLFSAKGTTTINRIRNIHLTPEVDEFTVTSLGSRASHFKVSPYTTESTTVFIGTQSGRVFKVTNAESDSPIPVEIGSGTFPTGNVSCIELGENENEVLVTFTNYGVNSVWYTPDGGVSWVSKEGDLPDMPVRWALFNPNDRTQVILATEVGVWSSSNFNDENPNWIPSNSGLANVRVDMLQIRESDFQVLAATHGRGFFTSNGFSNIDENVLGAYFSAEGNINIGINGTVNFNDLSTGTPSTWSWTFEGGTPSSSTEQNPSVTYSLPGVYDVTLTVNDGGSPVSVTRSGYIKVGQEVAWVEQATGFSNVSRGIDYIDVVNSDIVWAKAYDGSSTDTKIKEFTKTIDGGETWVPYTINITGDIYPAMICAHDADVAWIPMYPNTVGAGGGIYITEDGGSSWTKQVSASFTGDDAFANVVHFWDRNNGFCMGDPNEGYFEIYTTSNGGNTWSRVSSSNIPSPETDEYGTVGLFSVADDGTVFFNTTKGRIFKSVNRGASWSVITTPLSERNRIAFADENNGVIIESNDNPTLAKVYRTEDGGTTWENVSNTNVFNSFIEYVPGTDRMYVSSSGNTSKAGASYSIDGGKTWEVFSEQEGKQCLAIGFYNMSIGWFGQFNASDTDGGILKYLGPATIPGFTINPENVVVQEASMFTDITLSSEIDKTYSWNFGENSIPATATGEGPHSVIYSQGGDKSVTLTVNGISFTKDFNIEYLSVDEVENETRTKINIYPNPSDGIFNLKYESLDNAEGLIYFYNLNGQLVHHTKLNPGESRSVNLAEYGKGLFLMRVKNGNTSKTYKLLVE